MKRELVLRRVACTWLVACVAMLGTGQVALGAEEPREQSGDVSAQSFEKITAWDGAADDQFGTSVAVSGDIAVVGAPYDDTAGGTMAGAAYVYIRDGVNWVYEWKLAPTDPADYDYFGESVAVYGDTVVVGADGKASLRGAAYVFTRSASGVWTQQQKLLPAAAGPNDHVGWDVALHQNTAVLGTWGDERAYVYVRSGSTWTLQQALEDPSPESGDMFGESVAVYRDTVLVGAGYDDFQRGSAWVFVRTGTTWSLQRQLVASDDANNDWFGQSVDLYRDYALIGAKGDDDHGAVSGSVYLFARSGTSWAQVDKLTPDAVTAGDYFGSAVALSGDTAVVGAPGDDSSMGAAYVCTVTSAGLTLRGTLLADDAGADDWYASAVDVSGGKICIGAHLDDDEGNASGSAYFYIAEAPSLPGMARVAGSSRYLTAVEASKQAFPLGASAVVLATGENWPDALGGSGLAGALRSPILLTRQATLPAEVRAEIVRLGATKVYVLGGTSAVSTAVENQLVTLMGRSDVVRIAGGSRYQTAQMVADEVIRVMGADFGGALFVATGASFADATAASPLCAWHGIPIVLADPRASSVYVPTRAERIFILGGTSAVSSGIEDYLVSVRDRENVIRYSGANRYETAVEVAELGVLSGMFWHGVGLASGTAFPDALSGGVLLGMRRTVLLLTDPATLSPSTRSALVLHEPQIANSMHIIGGTSAVSSAVEAEARAAAGM